MGKKKQQKKIEIAEQRRQSEIKTEVFIQQKAAYYAALVDGFSTSRRDIDLNIMTISGGGIGLLITLLVTQGQLASQVLAVGIAAILLFVVSILHVMRVMKLDSKYMLLLCKQEDEDTEEVRCDIKRMDEKLKQHDRFVLVWFLSGIALSLFFAIFRAVGFIHN